MNMADDMSLIVKNGYKNQENSSFNSSSNLCLWDQRNVYKFMLSITYTYEWIQK